MNLRLRDVLVALALTPVSLAGLVAGPMSERAYAPRGADLLGVVLTLGMTMPVVALRTHPRPAIVVAGASALTISVAGYGFMLGALIVWVLVGVAALRSDRRFSVLLGAASAVAVMLSVAAFSPDNRDPAALALAAAVGLMPVLAGDALRRQRELTDEVRRLQQHAIDAERLRIARDVHDTVGHHLSAISLQARAGALTDGTEALAAIARLSDRAIDEIRATLGTIRSADGLRPTPRIEHFEDLVETAALAGVEVQVRIDGPTDDLSDRVSTCAYRVVQEALTNTAKHAAPARAWVEVRRRAGELLITIRDDGRAPGGGPEGHGIAGMRERVHSLGGTLTATPDRPSGWRVHAALPEG